jgi:methionyl-tRNA formyltransferase
LISKKIHLFTNEFEIIKSLQSIFEIKKIFTEKIKLFKKLKKKNNIVLIRSYKDLMKDNTGSLETGISYGFGIIFKENFLKKYKNGIWNIHPGSLPNYRGRHPITAAFLNDEKKIGLSIHIIDKKIDRGFLLAKSFVQRNYKDDELSIKKKLFRILKKVLKKAEANFNKKKMIKLLKGKYYKPFYNGVYVKDSKKIDYKFIYNATKAQKSFDGIYVNGKKYYNAFFYSLKNLNKKNIEIIICKNNKKVILVNKR